MMATLLERVMKWDGGLSRDQAYALIACGEVLVDGERIRVPKQAVDDDAVLVRKPFEFVSRGGVKLQAALSAWRVEVRGKTILDAGASTGGFTHCLLENGAKAVHAVERGYNQIDYRLRSDPRVIVHERTNIMDVTALDPPCDAAVADLSLRSILGAASHIGSLTRERRLIALIKPQYELHDAPPGFHGVVRDRGRLADILLQVARGLVSEKMRMTHLMQSPIQGRGGNTEFLAWLVEDLDVSPRSAVDGALGLIGSALEETL